ncbi:MAG: Sua5/YciO/YrdC/YwlC family protein, partial [Candidatus Bathyarchaeota archaeon]|nr:Sua5/YciO/YrdC/YwlC family protein [Candidatus Bathyarchaeota archaeon]
PPSTATEAYKQLKDEIDVILDGGMTGFGVSSTMLDLTGEKPKILRIGPITLENLLEFGFIP